MVLRFHQDVIALQPKAVVILAGTNDIAGNTGPMTLEQTEDNLAAMAEMATSNHIRVVLCSVLPAFDYPWQPGLFPAPKIDTINAWIEAYAAQHGHVYVDYHSAMKDERDGLPANLSHSRRASNACRLCHHGTARGSGHRQGARAVGELRNNANPPTIE